MTVRLFTTRFVLAGLAALPLGNAAAQTTHPSITISDSVNYRVRISTSITIPRGKTDIDRIRVWQALPPDRLWDGVSGPVGASAIKSYNRGAEQQYNQQHNSHHMYWETVAPQKPGARYRVVTDFTVRSAQREFRPERANIRWQDYQKPLRDPKAKVDPAAAAKVHPTIARVADQYKQRLAPAITVREFCKWIYQSVKYDASVGYPPGDVNSIVQNARGHCGHQSTVLEQLCQRAGIPYRRVFGMNLYDTDGRDRLSAIRSDYTNTHTWAEVYFPGIGWVEVEPSAGVNAFRIPARFIQNNPWFQNYAVWMRENGTPRLTTWTYRNGRYFTDHGVDNVITFAIVR